MLCARRPAFAFDTVLKMIETLEERIQGLTMGQEILKRCDEIWVYGPNISQGMKYEIETAKELGKLSDYSMRMVSLLIHIPWKLMTG